MIVQSRTHIWYGDQNQKQNNERRSGRTLQKRRFMTVGTLIEMLTKLDNRNALVCVPDYSLCTCNARDGEYQANTLTLKREDTLTPFVVIE